MFFALRFIGLLLLEPSYTPKTKPNPTETNNSTMHTTSLITLALTGLALAKPGAPPAVPIPLSDDPALCLKRLETFPNRSPNRFDVLGGRCLQARTYKGKFGPYNGDFFFETCCTDSGNQFGEPTYVNVDECVVFEPQNGTLIWNSQSS